MDIEELDHVLAFCHSLQAFYLGLQQNVMYFVVDATHVDALDGYGGVYIDSGCLLVSSLIPR